MANDKREFGAAYLYAEDLLSGGKFHTVTAEISEVHPPNSLKAANGKTIDKWVIGFKGKDKMLCLCKTNASIIHIVTGEPAGDKWIGKTITIQARIGKAFGAETLWIRVIPPTGTKLRRTLYERLGVEATYNPATTSEDS